MEAIILAGGLGTRLRSRLPELPKSMAPVAGRPFLAILLDQMVNAGCGRILLSVGYRREAILETFGGRYKGVPLHYVVEEEPLGTGGAIRLALAEAEGTAIVINGDTYLDLSVTEMFAFHARTGSTMTMAVTEVEDMARYGGVVIEREHVIGFVEKGHTGRGWINAGAYVLGQDFPWPEGLPRKCSFENDVLVPFVNEMLPGAFRHLGRFLDIGIPEDLDRAQVELAG
jgi:D-glycero-alpha-D-manno-heptose 1-phosphate guanylyltransferase